MPVNELTVLDYLILPVVDLANHPKYSAATFQKVLTISMMDGPQVDRLNISGRTAK